MIYKKSSNLGNKLKQLRLHNNLLQKQVADYLKVAKSTYSQYETSNSRPDYETLKSLAVLYKVSIDELLDHEIISENKEEIDFKKLKRLTKKELGSKGILFYDTDKISNDELNIIEAVFNAISNKNK